MRVISHGVCAIHAPAEIAPLPAGRVGLIRSSDCEAGGSGPHAGGEQGAECVVLCAAMEAEIAEAGVDMRRTSLEVLEQYWRKAKKSLE